MSLFDTLVLAAEEAKALETLSFPIRPVSSEELLLTLKTQTARKLGVEVFSRKRTHAQLTDGAPSRMCPHCKITTKYHRACQVCNIGDDKVLTKVSYSLSQEPNFAYSEKFFISCPRGHEKLGAVEFFTVDGAVVRVEKVHTVNPTMRGNCNFIFSVINPSQTYEFYELLIYRYIVSD